MEEGLSADEVYVERVLPGKMRWNLDYMQKFTYFKEWKIIQGEDVVIGNPQATTTYFTMVDDEVTIEAVYDILYMIDITRGDAPLEAFAGEVVSITANTKYGEFTN